LDFGPSIVEYVLPEESPSGADFRKRVEWLMLLRLVVTTLLLGATIFFQLSWSQAFFVYPAIVLYVLIAATFLLSLLYAVALPLIPNLWKFSFFQVMVDVVYYTALIYFTGGASSAFSLIYIFPIISSGILHFRRGALATASAASVLFGLLINLEFHGVIPASEWQWVVPWAKQSPGYVLWLMVVHFTVFFLAAFLSSSIAEQLQSTKVDLKIKETDYEELSDLHSNIVQSIPSGLVTTDEYDRITFVNGAGARLLGSSLPELVGVPITEVFSVLDGSLTTSGMGRRTYETTKEIDGETGQLELSVSDLVDHGGVPRGRLVVFHDVTVLRRMEDRVKLSDRQAALVRIAAGMAHEIRNPLAAVRGATELLSQYSEGLEDQKKLLSIVIRESDRLNDLLGDFLVTVNPRRKQKAHVMLNDLVVETVDLFSKEPRVRDRVSVETLVNRGVEVQGDPQRLKQALWNLLSNALEATPDGGVVRVSLESDEKPGQAVLRVKDSGTGIPPEIKDRIFEPFTSTKEGGTGLGLPMVLSIVEAHEGTIEIEEQWSIGTAFVIRLPVAGGVYSVVGEEIGNG